MFSFQEVKTWYDHHESNFKIVLDRIDNIMVRAKDKKLPIYATHCRVKSIDSAFRKTKRDPTIADLDTLTDIAGYRIVCLFEENLYDIHKYIIDELGNNFVLIEDVKAFNWKNDDQFIKDMKESMASSAFKDRNIKVKHKETGYKAIHYIFNYLLEGRGYFVEIQLRTLLQDVWGELEHKLKYKQGNVHPHINRSFELLSQNLQTNDSLISHLKIISDREKVTHLYSMEQGGPYNYYGYEKHKIPELFNTEPFLTPFNNYREFWREKETKSIMEDKSVSLEKGKALLLELIGPITKTIEKKQKDKRLDYFIKMEEAFFMFWEGGSKNLEEALKIYKVIQDESGEEHYILHFRMGEIYFIKGDNDRALEHFDRCEIILDKLDKLGELDQFNHFRVKLKLAYIYWFLGHEYMHITLEKMEDAKNIFESNKKVFSGEEEQDHELVLNNLCSYYLENYIKIKKEETDKKEKKDEKRIEQSYRKAKEKLLDLEIFMKTRKASANILDTMAWSYYHIYLEEKDKNILECAQKLCRLMGERENYSTYKLTSLAIQSNHIQVIMSAK